MRATALCFLAATLVAASPNKLPSTCGRNACYPVLVGPKLKDIAKDFCSYYLKYPKHTSKTVSCKATVTESCTIPVSTVKSTTTTIETIPAALTVTATAPDVVVTVTEIATTTQAPGPRRRTVGHWAPPPGSGSAYKPPALALFAPAVVSSACSCLVAPTTVTHTTTVKATATVKNKCTSRTVTSGVQTVTETTTSTITLDVTVPGGELTATVTSTTTVAPPAPTCNYPENDQQGVRGVRRPGSDGAYLEEDPVADAATCYQIVKTEKDYFDRPLNLQSYTFQSNANPGGPAGPGVCRGYQTRSCENLIPDPAGDQYGGDTSLSYE